VDARGVRRTLAAGGAAAAILGLGVWQFGADAAPKGAVSTSRAVPASRPAPPAPDDSNVITVDGESDALDSGTTPMTQRVAVVGLLNKRNGVSRDVTLKPGQAIRVGDTVVRLRACEQTAPWEVEQLTGAFVQLDVRGVDQKWRRAFSGWLYKERPALNVVQHPVYDVWAKSCTMAFPAKGPDTDVLAAPSTARKSAPPAAQSGPAEEEAAPESPASESASNAI
jgi:hypothetical protein